MPSDARVSRFRHNGPVFLSLVLVVYLVATSASAAESVWVLWVETPMGSDQWRVAATGEPKFRTKDECERRARQLSDTEQAIAQIEGMQGDARDTFSCLPDTVDPRPEGALRSPSSAR